MKQGSLILGALAGIVLFFGFQSARDCYQMLWAQELPYVFCYALGSVYLVGFLATSHIIRIVRERRRGARFVRRPPLLTPLIGIMVGQEFGAVALNVVKPIAPIVRLATGLAWLTIGILSSFLIADWIHNALNQPPAGRSS